MATLKESLEQQTKLAKQINDIYKGDGFRQFQEIAIGASKLVRDLGVSSIVNNNLGVPSISKMGVFPIFQEIQKQSIWYKTIQEQANWAKKMNLTKVSEITKLIVPFSEIANEYISSTLDFFNNSETTAESELVEEFQNISNQFEEILESPEVPEEFHDNIIAIKESIESMDNSEIKNELIQMSTQFKVIEANIETNDNSNTTVVFPPEFMSVFQSLNDNMINLANKIEKYPNTSESVKLRKMLRKQFITFIFWIVTSFIAGYIGAFAVDCYNSSRLHKEMTQQVLSPLETNQSSRAEKNESDLAPNNQSNHNE